MHRGLRLSLLAAAVAGVPLGSMALTWGPGPDPGPPIGREETTRVHPPAPEPSPGLLRDWDPEHAPDLAKAPPFPVETGERPTRGQARAFANTYGNFLAKGDAGLDKLRAEGHLRGAGTPADPYRLDRFYVDGDLTIQNTTRALVLSEGFVEGQLRLNYAGPAVYVHHVYAKDLRINENVKRIAPNTGGLFHDNHFGFVGQIRHFVGEFRNNQVGPRPAGAVTTYLGDTGVLDLDEGVVFNFDGFHAADVHHNRFDGAVDIKLHGHNHADCFTCPIHDHADPSLFPAHDDRGEGFRSRHSTRYVSLLFRDNEVQVEKGTALRYNDRNHAGDDRTANSEPNPYLEDPHVHHQDITVRGNRISGGTLEVDVFNAADERHTGANRGILRIQGNEIRLRRDPGSLLESPRSQDGVRVRTAAGLDLVLESNRIRFDDQADGPVGNPIGAEPKDAGIRFDRVDRSNLTIRANAVADALYGVFAAHLSGTTRWSLQSNEFETTHAWRGQDVAHPPEEGGENP